MSLLARWPVLRHGSDPADRGAIWRFYTHPGRYLTRRSFDSFEGMLDLVLDNFRSGAYRWLPDDEILLTAPSFED
jgi:hypothetical protein